MTPRHLFFSHASEDKPTVEMVAALLLQHRPDVHIWIDKYEIVAGADLLETIGAGMDRAEHFFVFISPVSVGKPWVRAELHDALTQDITGCKPGFVVPVLLGQPAEFPAFLRARKYIDVSGVPEVWLREFDGILDGAFKDGPQMRPNLTVNIALGKGPAVSEGDPAKTATVT